MSKLLKRYCPRTEFSSYEDMKENFKINVPDDFNFGFDVVDAWAELEPEKLALRRTDDAGNLEEYSFKDIKEMSARTANFLHSCGIRRGDVVLLILKQRVEVWAYMTALHKLGAVVIPGSFQLTAKDLVYRLTASGASALVTVDDADITAHVQTARKDCPFVHTYITVGDQPVPDALDHRRLIHDFSPCFNKAQAGQHRVTDPMLIYFSSGTSGMPKMVRHDFSSPLGYITNALFWQCAEENAVHMTQTDSGWAKFAWGKIYGQWLCGAAIGAYDTEKFIPKAMIEAMQRLRPATFCAPATIYRMLIKEDISQYDFSYIHYATVAGEPLIPEVFHQFQRQTGLTIHEGFGQSEGSVLLANFPWFPIRPGSMGKPAPIYDIDLLDEDGQPCEDGVVGAICIKNVNREHPTGLFREYWKAPEVMEKSFRHGHYYTGDMAWRDSDGYHWFEGRGDDVIKCAGYRIGPFEVESALMEHPAVLECAVTAVPDAVRGEIVKATVVLTKGVAPSDALIKEMQNHVKRVTAPYKYPRRIDFTDELPKTSSGKIMRAVIRRKDLERLQEDGRSI
jgi:acetyl-CoA synthetase